MSKALRCNKNSLLLDSADWTIHNNYLFKSDKQATIRIYF